MNSRVYKTVSIFAVAVSMFVLGCNNANMGYGSSPSTAPTKTAPNTVAISNYSFSPATMTVAKGTVITWQNNDAVGHSSTSNSGAWDTGILAQGGSATTAFSTSGTFPYHCSAHPMMTGTITVQ